MTIDSLEWTKPKTVQTKFGERILRTAVPTPEFWEKWREDKNAVRAAGYSVSKDGEKWQVAHWAKPDAEVLAQRERSVEMSRALTSGSDYPAPEGLSYLGFQKAVVDYAMEREGTLAATPPGTGKTIMAAGFINANPDFKKVLVICPATLRLNWKRELDKWLIQHYNTGVVVRDDFPDDLDIVIINYDVVKKHHERLTATEWDLLVIDEAHYLKNPSTYRNQYIFGKKSKKIAPIKAGRRLFLTGTPIMNKPIDIFELVKQLDPVTWSNKHKFALRYCGATNNGWGWDYNGASNLSELQDRLRSTVMVRFTREEALPDLPKKFRQIIEIPANVKERAAINRESKAWDEDMMSELRARVELAKVSGSEEEYREAVTKLREGAGTNFSEIAKLRQEVALLKAPYVLEHVKTFDEKVILFAHHRAVIDLFKTALGDEAVVLVGDTKLEDRQIAVDRFQNDPSVKYFLGSMKAASEGITLTAASKVVFAELDYVPATMSQAESRAQRIGQTSNVLVQHLVFEGSLDVSIANTLIKKQQIIDEALDDAYTLEELKQPEISFGSNDTAYPPKKVIEKEAEAISPEEVAEIHAALKALAELDADRARNANGVGFNRIDSAIGHSLANSPFLSPRQAALGKRLVTKYRRQLSA